MKAGNCDSCSNQVTGGDKKKKLNVNYPYIIYL